MLYFKHYYQKVREVGMMNCLRKASYYLRGLYYRIYFEKCGPLQVMGRIYVQKKNARIKIGKCLIWQHVKFDMEGKGRNTRAILEIGDFTTIGDRTEIHVAEKVIIGKQCRIAWDCVIMDRNYHGIGCASEIIKPVIIEDDVWIGCKTIILPGVTLGKKSVVAAGSVVTKDVQPYTLVAGNPAMLVKNIDEKGKSFTSNR